MAEKDQLRRRIKNMQPVVEQAKRLAAKLPALSALDEAGIQSLNVTLTIAEARSYLQAIESLNIGVQAPRGTRTSPRPTPQRSGTEATEGARQNREPEAVGPWTAG